MVETKVPMDVRTYKAKLVGPFTTRQLICGALAAAIDLVMYFGFFSKSGIGLKPAIFILIFSNVPILAFTFDVMGMPMEQYLKTVLLRSLIVPTKRKAKSDLPQRPAAVYTKAELKASKKKMKILLKTRPEYKAYK